MKILVIVALMAVAVSVFCACTGPYSELIVMMFYASMGAWCGCWLAEKFCRWIGPIMERAIVDGYNESKK
jgi:hypothetical protein